MSVEKSNINKEEKSLKKDDFLVKIVYNEIAIKTDFIRLDQFLKFSDIASSGGIAKMMILEGLIRVNDKICIMRGKKLYKNDTVFFYDENLPKYFAYRII